MKTKKAKKSDKTTLKYALVSVFDKTGIVELAKTLSSQGYKIISTGGTATTLIDAKIPVIAIQSITGNAESFDGRMKTISFQAEGGILYDRSNIKHVQQATDLRVPRIDVVVCNLYPFEATLKKKNVTDAEIVENIDVGGPTMIRSAAKNHKYVVVVTDTQDYVKVIKAMETNTLTQDFRRELAAKAFKHLSFYDSQIAKHLSKNSFDKEDTIAGRRAVELRYGENPHQVPSHLYFEPGTNSPLSKLKKEIGRELSYVNVTDIAAGLESVRVFKEPCAVVIKHNSPCGIAIGKDSKEALQRAVEADPESAFGGVVVINRPIDLATAKAFVDFKQDRVQMDIVAAPFIENKAKEIINNVRRSTGIYTFGKIPSRRSNKVHLRFIDGGYVAQPWDDDIEKSFANWVTVTKKKPSKKQLEQMKIGWKFATRIKSNTILVVDGRLPMTRGIGSGQTSRIRSTKIAIEQAGAHSEGGILISDSFFPFDDSIKYAARFGICAILQQGGSVNDKISVAAADKLGIPMVFTQRRAFYH